jgi:DNA-binding NtrC family response regulator
MYIGCMALTASERTFFELVSRATFANPFGAERDALDRRIAEVPGHDRDLIERLVARIATRLGALERRDALHLERHEGADRVLVEHALLFDAFHRFRSALDASIEKQLRAGRAPIKVEFAAELVRLLVSRGFAPERARRALAVVFQIARAYFFLARDLAGRSRAMKRLRESLWNNVFTQDTALYERFLWNRMEDFSTILSGETGTGKGVAAAAIGRSGFIPFDERASAFEVSFTSTFVAINLSQFSETLIESELFGHAKGAFTGAVEKHAGVFARSGAFGSIFLDEIGEVSAPVQIKLLRVLQERAFSPVGSHEELRFQGRVIAATHRSIDALRESGRIREDFYYRLCSDVIAVPSLRERVAEVPGELDELVGHIVARIVGEPSDLAALVLERIERDLGRDYAWPGNVRELEQCVRRVLVTGSARAERAREQAAGGDLADRMRRHDLDARALVAGYCALLYRDLGSYARVAEVTKLDRRTVKAHVLEAMKAPA